MSTTFSFFGIVLHFSMVEMKLVCFYLQVHYWFLC